MNNTNKYPVCPMNNTNKYPVCRQVRLTDEQHARAKEIGTGSMSRGIRKALESYPDLSPSDLQRAADLGGGNIWQGIAVALREATGDIQDAGG